MSRGGKTDTILEWREIILLYPVLMEKSQSGTLPEELSFISTSSPFVRITALKKSESGNSLDIENG